MSNLPEHVAQSLRSRQLLLPGQAVLVAVSGGLDSMVLLRVLHELSRRSGWKLTVAHLNHQLRGRSSAADERLVRRAAAELGLPAVVGRADVRGFARAHQLSVEMAARRLRHDFLACAAVQKAIPTIALAHHADDQLEFFFLRLLRGSGGAGLAGMKWRSPSPANPTVTLARPLLDLPKAALREYARERKLPFREDASNAWLHIQRNRLRHELLPMLRRNYQPALDKTILRVMDILGAEAELAMQMAQDWLRGARIAGRGTSTGNRKPARPLTLALCWPHPFETLPVAVQRRCVQVQLLGLGIEPDYELVEQLRMAPGRPVSVRAGRAGGLSSGLCAALESPSSSSLKKDGKTRAGTRTTPNRTAMGVTGSEADGSPPQLWVVRDGRGRVHLHPSAQPAFHPGSLPVELKGKAGEAVFDGVRLRWRIDPAKPLTRQKVPAGREFFDADRLGTRVLLRHWRPGDRFQPIGLGNPVKLQDLFVNQKVPRARRHRLLVAVTVPGELFWVEGLRISERFKLTRDTIRRLQWGWQRL